MRALLHVAATAVQERTGAEEDRTAATDLRIAPTDAGRSR